MYYSNEELNLLMQRYGINRLEENMNSDIKMDRLFIIENENELSEEMLKQMPNCITKSEIEDLSKVKEIIVPRIPMLINTIENSYSNIGVYGKCEYADEIYHYLKKNKNIYITRISEAEFTYEKDKYILHCDKEIDILLVLDLITVKEIHDKNGRIILPLFAKKIYAPNLKTTGNNLDINSNILPYLLMNGVDVMWIGCPDMNRLIRKKVVGRVVKAWSILRNINDNLYNRIRHALFKTSYLYKESMSVYNSNVKGISEIFYNGKYINFENGFRITPGNSIEVDNSVWLFGPCYVRGVNFDDEHTMSAKLQNKLGKKYNVMNRGSVNTCLNYVMRLSEFKKGDIAIFFSPERVPENKIKNITYLDMTDIVNKVPYLERHITDSVFHCDETVIDAIVESIYEEINKKILPVDNLEKVFFGSKIKRVPSVDMYGKSEYSEWLQELRKYRKDGLNGSIVMNANPFTKGHLYLVEYAANRVDNLYLFVVQEDKSFFSYEDRMHLVKEGTKHLKNVMVLPSSRYIVSSSSLPGYFKKENMQGDFKLDATQDLISFAEAADILSIKIRFAGEEPKDIFTRQYNINMNNVLPKYGIEFVVISRKESNNQTISASLVRSYLKNNEFDKIREIVPESTHQRLVEMKKEGKF